MYCDQLPNMAIERTQKVPPHSLQMQANADRMTTQLDALIKALEEGLTTA
jgi:hypothetical protein